MTHPNSDSSQTHTLGVFEGSNAQRCLLSLGCLTVLECEPPPVVFWFGREGGPSIDVSLVITAYEMVSPPYNVTMKGMFRKDLVLLYTRSHRRPESEFIFSNYNTSTRKGSVIVPVRYVDEIRKYLSGTATTVV